MSVNFDNSELEAFSAELGRTADEVRGAARGVVSERAEALTDRMRNDMAASASFGHLAGSISFDMLDDLTAEIGPVKRYTGRREAPRRGANIAYFGTWKGGGSVDLDGAIDAERPQFEKAVLDAMRDLL